MITIRIQYLILFIFSFQGLFAQASDNKTDIRNLKVINDSLLNFDLINSVSNVNIEVWHYKWNSWILVLESAVQSCSDSCNLRYKLESITTGQNKLRITARVGKTIQAQSEFLFNSPRNFVPDKSNLKFRNQIILPQICSFEIYDISGNILLKGVSSRIKIRKLNKGSYYLRSCNGWQEFLKE